MWVHILTLECVTRPNIAFEIKSHKLQEFLVSNEGLNILQSEAEDAHNS